MIQSPVFRLALIAAFSLSSPSAQVATVVEHDFPADLDSGYVDNRGGAERVVFRETLAVDGAKILRLHFGICNLPEGSRMEITSLLDGDTQRLDGVSLVDYANSSAFFNGSEVEIKLIAGPQTLANRIQVVRMTSTEYPVDETICGAIDDRAVSTDNRQGRLSSGCTAWMIGNATALSAGHCGSTGRNMILSFRVPLSSAGGSLRASAVRDQYAYRVLAATANGVGADWGIARVSRNSNTGLRPVQAYGEGYYDLGTPPNQVANQTIRITGYGSVASGSNLPRSHNQVQKTHTGPFRFFSPTSLSYATDTTGGNSGSPVIHEQTGRAIGIHTHGGCGGGGANSGTRGDIPALLDAIATFTNQVANPPVVANFGAGCAGSLGVGTLNISGAPVIGNDFSLDLANLPPGVAGVIFMGTSRTTWQAAGLSLPLDLAMFSAPGCDLLVSPDRSFVKDSFVGTTSLVLPIPLVPGLIGADLYWQYVFVDLFFGDLIRTTNAVEMTIGG